MESQQEFNPEALLGSVLDGRYRLDSIIGAGRISVVYKALHELMNRDVAVKLLRPSVNSNPENVRLFRLEVQAVSSLDYPSIIRIHDFGVSQLGTSYLVTDLVKGKTLAEILKSTGSLDASRVLSIFLQCCEALSHAHKRGVVHRNLKPSNVMLATDHESQDQVRLVDFGVAKLVCDQSGDWRRLTPTGELSTELSYLSPEESRGDAVDARSDIFSLGCVMYEALTGAPPVLKQSLADGQSSGGSTSASKLERGLQAVVLKSMAKEPASRYQSADEVALDLIGLRSSSGGNKTHLTARNTGWAAPVLVLILVVCLTGWLILRSNGRLFQLRLVNYYIEATTSRTASKYLENSMLLAAEELRAGSAKEAIRILKGIELDVAGTFQDPSFQSTEVAVQLARAYKKAGLGTKAQRQFELASRRLGDLSFAEGRKGKVEQAVKTCERRLELHKEFCAPDSTELADAVLGLEEACSMNHQEARALQLIDQEVKQLTGKSDRVRGARQWLLSDKAGLLRSAGRLQEAEKVFLEVIEERKFVFGDTHPWTTDMLKQLGRLSIDLKKHDRADKLFKLALKNDEITLPVDVPTDLALIADLHYSKGERAEANRLYLEAFKRNEDVKTKDRNRYTNFLQTYSNFLRKDNREREAAAIDQLKLKPIKQ